MAKKEEQGNIEIGATIVLKALEGDELKISIDNSSWELMQDLLDDHVRNLFFAYKYYMRKEFDVLNDIIVGKNYKFILTKRTKKQINLILMNNSDNEK